MDILTNALIGKSLDWAVMVCEGYVQPNPIEWIVSGHFQPSTNWTQGGPIIEREGISTVQQGDASDWVASIYYHKSQDWQLHTTGKNPLIAAMRCYVAGKLGDTVDIPKEIL